MPRLRTAIFVALSVVLAAVVALVLLVVAVMSIDAAKRRARRRLVANVALPGRAMGYAEHGFDFMHRIGAFVVGQAALVEGPLDASMLRTALDVVQSRHPLLRVHVRGPEGVFFGDDAIAKTAPIPLRVVVGDDDESWKGELLREVGERIPFGPLPGVRVVWVSRPTVSALLIVANHAVYDGASAVTFVRELLMECGRLASPREGNDALPSPRPAAALDPLDVGLRGRTFPRPSKKAKLALLPPRPAARAADRRPALDYARIDADTMRALLATCRAEKTTVHGALSAAALFAVARVFGADRAMSLASNVNVRRELTPIVPPDVIGCFISGVTTSHFVAHDSDLWDTARAVRAEVTRLVEEGAHLRDLGSEFGAVHELAVRRVMARMHQGRLSVINVSNSGRFEIDRAFGPFALRELYALATQDVMGAVLQIAVMSLNEELFVSLSWATPLLSAGEAADIKNAFLHIVGAAARREPIRIERA